MIYVHPQYSLTDAFVGADIALLHMKEVPQFRLIIAYKFSTQPRKEINEKSYFR